MKNKLSELSEKVRKDYGMRFRSKEEAQEIAAYIAKLEAAIRATLHIAKTTYYE